MRALHIQAMAQMASEVYDALRSVNVPEGKARNGDENVAALKADMAVMAADIASLRADFTQMKWMLGVVLAMQAVILTRLLFMC
jgi:hypothetical protein